jgi:gliding motility-associated-like protein
VLSLRVNPSYRLNQTATISPCANIDFNGQIISTEGTYLNNFFTVLGCDSIIVLEVKKSQNNFLGGDTTLCSVNEYTIKSNFENTRWFDNDIAKTKTVNSNGLYWASYFDINGCEIFDTISVQFNFKSYVPNVFRPNSYGLNDCFRPYHSDDPQFIKYRFSVFDRWGSLVFTTTNQNDCWNGQTGGVTCIPGVYVYFIEADTPLCGKILFKGNVTLIK